MIQPIKIDDIDTSRLTARVIDFMVKNPGDLTIEHINSVNEKLLTHLVGNMSDEKRQYWIDIYAQALIKDSIDDSSSEASTILTEKPSDYEKLITEIAKYNTVKSTELVANKLNELKQQRTPFKSQYPKTSSILYVVANVLTATMIWLLPKLWHELMGTSPKKDIKQPILSNQERIRLRQIATLQKTQDKLTTLRDSCPDTLVQGSFTERTYCDEAKPMYEQLNEFISQIVIQQDKLTKQINPLHPNELLKESMLIEELQKASRDETRWPQFLDEIRNILSIVDPITNDMPTNDERALQHFACCLSYEDKDHVQKQQHMLTQMTEPAKRYSTLFTTFKAYLPDEAEMAQSSIRKINIKRDLLDRLSSTIEHVGLLQQTAKTTDEQYSSQLGALTPIIHFEHSIFASKSTPVPLTNQVEFPATPYCLRDKVLANQETTIDDADSDISLNLPPRTDNDADITLNLPPRTDNDADSNFSLNLSPLTKYGDPNFTLQLAPHDGHNTSFDFN